MAGQAAQGSGPPGPQRALKTGRLKHNAWKAPKVDQITRDICPSPPNTMDWSPSAYSSQTGFLYLPPNNLCVDERLSEVGYIEGTPISGPR